MEKSVPKVLKVKEETNDERFKDIHENLPKPPCLILLLGSVRSSKTTTILNFFANPSFYKDRFDIVRIVSTTAGQDSKGEILAKHFDLSTEYNDDIIKEIKDSQSQYSKKERPTYALVLDDILTKDFSKNNAVSFFATRFRHYIDMYLIATQTFRAVSGMIRNNANAVLICRQQNAKEIQKIMEEYGSMVGGDENFMRLYKEIHKVPYSIMYIDLMSNPARVLRNFEEVLWEGDD